MWNGPTYDCRRCGACCANQESTPATGYVYLIRDESRRMRRLGLSVVSTAGGSFLGTRADADGGAYPLCVAFRGEVGGPGRCSIYPHRPWNCRQFLVGSPSCKAAREGAGLSV